MLTIGTLVGCQTAHVDQPVTAKFGGSDVDQQMDFWHTLGEQRVTSNDDAFHGLLLYLDGKDGSADYAGRVQTLKSRGLLAQGFQSPANEAVSRGTLAVAIVKALDIKGGWAMRVFGPTPRYATRELQYLDLYPLSSENQTFTGAEFLGIMGKFEDEQNERQAAATPDSGPIPEPELLNPENRRASPPSARPSVESK